MRSIDGHPLVAEDLHFSPDVWHSIRSRDLTQPISSILDEIGYPFASEAVSLSAAGAPYWVADALSERVGASVMRLERRRLDSKNEPLQWDTEWWRSSGVRFLAVSRPSAG
jgi:DNA-binding GntR family transcriptional regulator